jgi:AraC-like DNA-binding protein
MIATICKKPKSAFGSIILPTTRRSRFFLSISFLVWCSVSLLTIRSSGQIIHDGRTTTDSLLPPTAPRSDIAPTTIIVDILSIGSTKRPEHQKTQSETFGTHRAIRNFFVATELVDSDPDCSSHLTLPDAFHISHFCRTQKVWDNATAQWHMSSLQPHYIDKDRLSKNPSPAGWLCAQARPVHALFRLQQYFEQTPSQSYPHYLIIMDDDTIYDMEKFVTHFSAAQFSAEATAVAGCRIKIARLLTFPYGGFGLILSRGALAELLIPVDCSSGGNRHHHHHHQRPALCERLAQNRIGEFAVFENRTISLVQGMNDYAAQSPFREYANWTTGYCLHSDWATGYLVHMLVNSTGRGSYSSARLRAYNTGPNMKSEFKLRLNTDKARENICRYEGDECIAGISEVCHYATPAIMRRVFEQQKARTPDAFRPAGQGPRILELWKDSSSI